MIRIARFVGYFLGGLIGLILIALLVIYIWSEVILRRHYEASPEPMVAAPPELVAQGYRLARLQGCLSCHGEGLTGNDVINAPIVGDIIAPNLPRLARQRTDEELAVAIRQGIAPDGRGLLVMTSAVQGRMPPEETAALIAWIRSLPVTAGEERPFRLSMVGRLMLVLGDFRLQPVAVRQYRTRMPVDLGPRFARGRQLAASICAECHGPDLAGGPTPMADINPSLRRTYNLPPNLDIVGAYDLPAFTRLMRTGVPPDGRNLGMMTAVARRDLSHFTDEEIEALHQYLAERAQRGGS
jgi:mono/diheme cytochrome c family protein